MARLRIVRRRVGDSEVLMRFELVGLVDLVGLGERPERVEMGKKQRLSSSKPRAGASETATAALAREPRFSGFASLSIP